MTDKELRHITADDLYRVQLIQDAQVSPDGRHVIYVRQWTKREGEKKYSNLWVTPVDGGKPRQFTYGEHSDGNPRWSPDGKTVAFVSNRDNEQQSQIYLLPFDGGEARRLTDLKGSIADFSWSPDGTTLLMQFRKKDADAVEREEDEAKKQLGVVARRITRIDFKMDGAGYLPQEHWHIWTVNVESGEATQLTSGDYDEGSPRWSPDGKEIAFIVNRSDQPDLTAEMDDIYVMGADGSDERQLPTPEGGKMALNYSPEGDYLSYVARPEPGNWWRNNRLWIVPADGSSEAQQLTASEIHVSNSTIGDVGDRGMTAPIWYPDGESIAFQQSQHGNTIVRRVDLQGNVTDLLAEEGMYSNITMSEDGKTLAFLWSNFDDPGQLWVMREGEAPQKLTKLNRDWLDEITLGKVETAWIKGEDGNDLQGWILTPPDFDPAKKYPSILEIHGGPWLQYGNIFMHEFYYLAAQGYVVHFCNPRGGHGYGEEHGQAIEQSWGDRDFADVMAWTDHVARQPYIDTGRMGVAGGSYGGFMTLWTITHTDRFKAAVAQRVVSNFISFWGSSDVGIHFEGPWAGDCAPWEAVDQYWQQSPMSHIANVKTPTMIIHSEQDMRCNPEQGVQVFMALRKLGIETELILFPEESHGLSRGGRTDRRIARLQHMQRWFDDHL